MCFVLCSFHLTYNFNHFKRVCAIRINLFRSFCSHSCVQFDNAFVLGGIIVWHRNQSLGLYIWNSVLVFLLQVFVCALACIAYVSAGFLGGGGGGNSGGGGGGGYGGKNHPSNNLNFWCVAIEIVNSYGLIWKCKKKESKSNRWISIWSDFPVKTFEN